MFVFRSFRRGLGIGDCFETVRRWKHTGERIQRYRSDSIAVRSPGRGIWGTFG